MKQGGWAAFREASKHKAIAATAAEELERPVVSHRVSIPPLDEPAIPLHETPTAEPPPLAEPLPADTGEEPPLEKSAARDDIRHPFAAAGARFAAAASQFRERRPRTGGPVAVEEGYAVVPRRPFKVPHWYVVAVLPFTAALGLVALQAGVNPTALCLHWWDFAFGAVFVAAVLSFFALAALKVPVAGGRHPGSPALTAAVLVIPFWAAASLLFGDTCAAASKPLAAAPPPVTRSAAAAEPEPSVPPLPPPIEVPSLWTVPVPEPRPSGL